MPRESATQRLPKKANAGLNFYVSIAVVAGPTQLAILEEAFPDQDLAPTLVIVTTVLSLFLAPALTQIAFRSRTDSFVMGFLIRALLTLGLGVLVATALAIPFASGAVFWMYLLVFLLLGLAHKIYFNVGWLHVMGAVTPKETATAFVANVRSVNGVTTAVLSAGTLLVLQFVGSEGFLIYVWTCAFAYALWSFLLIRHAVQDDAALSTTLQQSFTREATRYPLADLLREFRYARTWRLLWPAFFPTFLVPPVLFLYAVEVLTLDWQNVIFCILASQLFASLALPRFIQLFLSVPIDRMRLLLFLLAIVNLALLIGNKLADLSDVATLGLVAVNSILAALIGQTLSIVVHNEVIRIGISQSESPRTFIVYNFALDVFPGIWMILGSLLVTASGPQALLNPYEALCITGLTIFASFRIVVSLTNMRRLGVG